MGLDMSIYMINKDSSEDTEIAYWRKEHELHELFNELADKKEIQYESFNCIKVPLLIKDIDYIIKKLPETRLHDKTTTKEKLLYCKFLIGINTKLYYDSWW